MLVPMGVGRPNVGSGRSPALISPGASYEWMCNALPIRRAGACFRAWSPDPMDVGTLVDPSVVPTPVSAPFPG